MGDITLTVDLSDKREFWLFMQFLKFVEKEGMPVWQAYGEVYGEVVFEDKSAMVSNTVAGDKS